MSEWISVNDRLPKQGEIVIVFSCWGEYEDDDYETSIQRFDVDYYKANDITHWMPLPEPPK